MYSEGELWSFLFLFAALIGGGVDPGLVVPYMGALALLWGGVLAPSPSRVPSTLCLQ